MYISYHISYPSALYIDVVSYMYILRSSYKLYNKLTSLQILQYKKSNKITMSFKLQTQEHRDFERKKHRLHLATSYAT